MSGKKADVQTWIMAGITSMGRVVMITEETAWKVGGDGHCRGEWRVENLPWEADVGTET